MAPSSAVSSVAPSSAAATSSVPLLHRIDEFDELLAENELLLERLERIERRQGIIDEYLGDEDSDDDDGEPEIAMDWIPVDQHDEDDEDDILDFSDGEGEDILAVNFSVMSTNEAIEANDTDDDFVVIQGLLGRMTGYDDNGNLPFDLPFELPIEEPISHPA